MIYTMILTIIMGVNGHSVQIQQYEHDYPTADMCHKLYAVKRDAILKAAADMYMRPDVSVNGNCVAIPK